MPVGVGTPTREDRGDHRRRDARRDDGATGEAAAGAGSGELPAHRRADAGAGACKAGADGAEVLVRDGTELEVKVRLGEPELIKEAGSRALGPARAQGRPRGRHLHVGSAAGGAGALRARDASSWRRSPSPIRLRRCRRARRWRASVPDLDLWDEAVLSLDVAEADPARKRGRGGGAGARQARHQLRGRDVRAHGRARRRSRRRPGSRAAIAARTSRSSSSRSATTPTARSATAIYWTAIRFAGDARTTPRQVGLEAARRTVAKLGSRKIADRRGAGDLRRPRPARGLLGQLAGVMSGGAVWRKSSYLAGREGTAVASPLVTIVDDPLMRRGPGSRPFDGDGLASRARTCWSRRGMLRTFLCDVYAARKLGRRSTGSAARGIGGSPHVDHVEPHPAAGHGRRRRSSSRSSAGLYVTDLMGFGFNAVTGDFSHGAGGFWIEKRRARLPGQRDHHLGELRRSVEAHRRAWATTSTRVRRCSARRSACRTMTIAGS